MKSGKAFDQDDIQAEASRMRGERAVVFPQTTNLETERMPFGAKINGTGSDFSE